MLARNDAEQIVCSVIDGAAAGAAMAVVSKSISFTISDGATDFAVGDKFTIALTKNPPAAGSITADANNTGNGTGSAVTVVGAVPDETITLVCTAAATNAGTFSVTGSKSGRHDDLTVAVAYTLVYQQIEVGDQIISAMVLADAWAAPSDDADNITVASGEITSTTNLSAASLFLVWRDVTAG